jgi:hypothetical protein
MSNRGRIPFVVQISVACDVLNTVFRDGFAFWSCDC